MTTQYLREEVKMAEYDRNDSDYETKDISDTLDASLKNESIKEDNQEQENVTDYDEFRQLFKILLWVAAISIGVWLVMQSVNVFVEYVWPLIIGFLVLMLIFGLWNRSSYSWDNQVREKVIRRAIERSGKK